MNQHLRDAVARRLECEAEKIWPESKSVPEWRLDTISVRARALEAQDLRDEAKHLRGRSGGKG